jgi:hypothetical protein
VLAATTVATLRYLKLAVHFVTPNFLASAFVNIDELQGYATTLCPEDLPYLHECLAAPSPAIPQVREAE